MDGKKPFGIIAQHGDRSERQGITEREDGSFFEKWKSGVHDLPVFKGRKKQFRIGFVYEKEKQYKETTWKPHGCDHFQFRKFWKIATQGKIQQCPK